nr:MAG TPA: hypothetical protein [Caudoviricetes sp.]
MIARHLVTCHIAAPIASTQNSLPPVNIATFITLKKAVLSTMKLKNGVKRIAHPQPTLKRSLV